MSEALHTRTLFGGLDIGTFGGCLGGRDWERVRLALAAAGRKQTCRGFGHGGGEWRDACAATWCLWVVSGSRAVVSARRNWEMPKNGSRALFQPAPWLFWFILPSIRSIAAV